LVAIISQHSRRTALAVSQFGAERITSLIACAILAVCWKLPCVFDLSLKRSWGFDWPFVWPFEELGVDAVMCAVETVMLNPSKREIIGNEAVGYI
jgi:enhancing lycopene biosynthesis protein 2